MATEVKKPGRKRGSTRISSKHQVTLSVDALAEAELKPGDRLRVTPQGRGRLLLEQESDEDWRRYIGIFHGMYPPGYLDELRNEWD
ncbi:MAG: AbrB/MazE/SpoVT family DNA-binding domain-containing protein [Chloroflexota bacterium]